MENNIGKRLVELRVKRNLTQEELAEKINSSASYISNIERKNKYPSLAFLKKLVEALDTTYDYLLLDDFEMDKRLKIQYDVMFKEITKMKDKTQEEFFKCANSVIQSLKNLEQDEIE